MKISYIHHSCFSIELEKSILLFDYYQGTLPNFNPEKAIYVFSSHNHNDHFSFSIFAIMEMYPNVHYIFSKDIKKRYNEKFFLSHGIDKSTYNQITFIPANSIFSTNEMQVETLTSTDEGVAFIVSIDNKTIYHAGDLHLWLWSGEGDDFNKNIDYLFKLEMAKIKSRHFDVAFLVLDPRQGNDFYLGFDYFMRNTNTDLVYPMHFWNDNSVISRLKSMECSTPYRAKIADI
ncbi:MAG: MBL fold metallo-hydrolase [Lachnospiraceae bacterium]|nr:MBL fold metallo-hydrolase [Lachnospiraceae bacterium]